MSKYVQDIDKGFRAFQKFLKDAQDPGIVEIGVLDTPFNNAPAFNDGPGANADAYSVVQYASVNEYGTKDGRIPARSFIGSTVDEKKRSISAKSVWMQRKLFLGQITLSQALGLMGEHIRNLVDDKIVNLRSPPNKPSTIKKKGSSNPLIDTGRLRQSISYQVKNGGMTDAQAADIAGALTE